MDNEKTMLVIALVVVSGLYLVNFLESQTPDSLEACEQKNYELTLEKFRLENQVEEARRLGRIEGELQMCISEDYMPEVTCQERI